jgi:hypothetical protein
MSYCTREGAATAHVVERTRLRSKAKAGGGGVSKTNLGEELGLNNERGVSGEVALAENLEVAVGSHVNDGDLLLGDGLWRAGISAERKRRGV